MTEQVKEEGIIEESNLDVETDINAIFSVKIFLKNSKQTQK
jgi:hypothetical protein